jgi:hypothetical protein
MKFNLKNKLSSALKSKAPVIESKAVEIKKTSKSTAEAVNHHLRSKELRESASKTSIDGHVDDKIVNFDYSQQKIDKLSSKFNIPADFIERGFKCSQRMGISTDYFIDKYLKRLDIKRNFEFTEAYKVILSELRIQLWSIR